MKMNDKKRDFYLNWLTKYLIKYIDKLNINYIK